MAELPAGPQRGGSAFGGDFAVEFTPIADKVEFMFGVGPEWIHTRAYGVTRNSLGGEAALDFMFWPSSKHRFGWFLEPGYDYSFAR